jgi:hypothetical protein
MPRRTKVATQVDARPPAPKPLFVPSVDELKRRMAKKPAPKVAVIESSPLRLRFGTGEEDGFTKMEPVWGDKVFIPSPWRLDNKNLRSESVEIVFFAWYMHRLSQSERFITMNEAYRVLRPGGQVMVVSPYWSSRRAVADPLALWPPVCEESFYVYSKAWRESEGVAPLVGLSCDFASMTPQGQLIVPSGHVPDPEVGPRSEEYRQHASRHFINAVWELHVTLTKAGE